MVRVPCEWTGETAVVVATGPSLTQDDVDYCRGKARVIVVNNAYQLAPWADAMFATDARFWHWVKGAPEFTGPKWSLEHSAWNPYRALYPEVKRLRNTGPGGLERVPTGLKNGRNSGYAAMNLAFHYGVNRIVMLGFDLQRTGGKSHYFGEHPNNSRSPYRQFIERFQTLVKPLEKSGVHVVNCSRVSVLPWFPKKPLRDVLKERSEVAA